jgi:hypothetical protein
MTASSLLGWRLWWDDDLLGSLEIDGFSRSNTITWSNELPVASRPHTVAVIVQPSSATS